MTIRITENSDAVTAILDGRLDTAASIQFAKDIEPLIEAADKKIVLDCANLQFISSSGLRLFLSLKKASMAKGGSVVIKDVVPSVKQVFTITGFSPLFVFE